MALVCGACGWSDKELDVEGRRTICWRCGDENPDLTDEEIEKLKAIEAESEKRNAEAMAKAKEEREAKARAAAEKAAAKKAEADAPKTEPEKPADPPIAYVAFTGKREIKYFVYTVTVDGVEFTTNDLDLLTDLCEADGFMNAMVVYDSDLRERVMKAGLAKANARGGLYGTDKLRLNFEAIEKILAEGDGSARIV